MSLGAGTAQPGSLAWLACEKAEGAGSRGGQAGWELAGGQSAWRGRHGAAGQHPAGLGTEGWWWQLRVCSSRLDLPTCPHIVSSVGHPEPSSLQGLWPWTRRCSSDACRVSPSAHRGCKLGGGRFPHTCQDEVGVCSESRVRLRDARVVIHLLTGPEPSWHSPSTMRDTNRTADKCKAVEQWNSAEAHKIKQVKDLGSQYSG